MCKPVAAMNEKTSQALIDKKEPACPICASAPLQNHQLTSHIYELVSTNGRNEFSVFLFQFASNAICCVCLGLGHKAQELLTSNCIYEWSLPPCFPSLTSLTYRHL
ncbi:unnamed protein product [Symbiodinium natans]|uniref:Uncharacterized protein n=1 Tax=Symbiodinium natans TaxID=878477 RepID=A0A812P7X8_9DINO|nr:unnamed protein product [Symbiodinium natans]